MRGRDGVRHTPNVVDAARFSPAPRPDLEVVPTLGFAGVLRPAKGLSTLIAAHERLLLARPSLRLLLVGGVAAAHAAAVRGRRGVEVLPWCGPDELPARYARCDVLAFPSDAEGLSNALLEAMACARPCVASRAGGGPEALEHGRSGLLVPPGEPEALAAAVLSLLDDPDRARALGEAARARVVATFGPDRERDELRAAYDVLLSR